MAIMLAISVMTFVLVFKLMRSNASASVALKSKTCGTLRLWLKTTWKMRSIYSGVVVHLFDFFTDLFVIHEWLFVQNRQLDSNEIDALHVDLEVMGYSAICVLIFYRIISALAIYVDGENDWKDSFLQLFDVLLFVEIYKSHKKLIESIFDGSLFDTTNPDKVEVNNDAIDSSMKFKYLRSLEACFESTPQAVLQLVYLMRNEDKIEALYVISIFQSIVSMTNCMINEDNVYMAHEKWDNYKKRFPIPHFQFLRFVCVKYNHRTAQKITPLALTAYSAFFCFVFILFYYLFFIFILIN